jgi:hypothetical protein
MNSAFDYIKACGGIDTEVSYPYEGVDGTCRFNPLNIGATCTGFVNVQAGSEAALKTAVTTYGPISVAIDASHDLFSYYESGVHDDPSCTTNLDHAGE